MKITTNGKRQLVVDLDYVYDIEFTVTSSTKIALGLSKCIKFYYTTGRVVMEEYGLISGVADEEIELIKFFEKDKSALENIFFTGVNNLRTYWD